MTQQSTKIVTDRQVDDPIVQPATFRYDKIDRAYVDSQIRGTQQHVVESLVSGFTATWFTVHPDSPDLAIGDVVCLQGTSQSAYLVTLAVPVALANAGRALGIVMTAASHGTDVRVAMMGVLPPSITGLIPSDNRAVRVSSAGRCESVASFSPGDFPVGFADSAANLSFNFSAGETGDGGPLTGDAGGHLALTYPNPALANGRTTVADLRALTLRVHRSEIHIAERNRAYRYDTSTGANVADNGYDCVKSTDVSLGSNGRWVGIGETVVPTIAALRTLTSGYSDKVFVQAYANAGDGGGGHFVKRTGSGTDNGGTIVVPTGITTFYYERQYSGAIDASWFGVAASTAGAQVDVAPAMQAAINATPVGGSLFVKAINAAAGLAYRLKSSNVTTSLGNYALNITKQIQIEGTAGPFVNGTAYFLCDSGLGAVHIAPVTGGNDARHTRLVGLSFHGNGSGGTVHGIFARTVFSFKRLYSCNFTGCGVYVDGSGIGDGSVANAWTADELVVNLNDQHGWFITGIDSNAGVGTAIFASSNGQVGIWDSSFLGNTYIGCQSDGNGAAVSGDPGDEKLHYKSDSGNNTTLFLNCYAEGDGWIELAEPSSWIGGQWGKGPTPVSGGRVLHPVLSYGLTCGVPKFDGSSGAHVSATLAPNEGKPVVLKFRLPNLSEGGDKDRSAYRFGIYEPYRNNSTIEAYAFWWADSGDYMPLGFTAESFYRGAGQALFPSGLYHRDISNTGLSKWYAVGTTIPFSAPASKAFEAGDTLEYPSPASGGYKGRVCTRAGYYGVAVQRNHVYALGAKVVPTVDNGHVYSCTTAGTSHATVEPSFNTGSGSNTTDGTAVFTEVGAASLWNDYGYVGTGGGPAGQDAGPTYSSQIITNHTSIGYAASSPDITVTKAIVHTRITSDGLNDWIVTLKKAGAVQGNTWEFTRTDTEDSNIVYKTEGGTTLYTQSQAGAVTPGNVTFVYDGSDFRYWRESLPRAV